MIKKFIICLGVLLLCACASVQKRNVAQNKGRPTCLPKKVLKIGDGMSLKNHEGLLQIGPREQENPSGHYELNMGNGNALIITTMLDEKEIREITPDDRLVVERLDIDKIVLKSQTNKIYSIACRYFRTKTSFRASYVEITRCTSEALRKLFDIDEDCSYRVTPANQQQIEQETNSPVEL